MEGMKSERPAFASFLKTDNPLMFLGSDPIRQISFSLIFHVSTDQYNCVIDYYIITRILFALSSTDIHCKNKPSK